MVEVDGTLEGAALAAPRPPPPLPAVDVAPPPAFGVAGAGACEADAEPLPPPAVGPPLAAGPPLARAGPALPRINPSAKPTVATIRLTCFFSLLRGRGRPRPASRGLARCSLLGHVGDGHQSSVLRPFRSGD
ncbi:MAG: hypothetical protein QOK39_836 [Acidimicrobiaceae bacterium]|nr:hypothetical protein [Acidimicrobiaceae bacterium]